MVWRTESERAAIQLDEINVRYRVPRERVTSLKEHAIRLLQRRVYNDEFWALRNVSLGIERGVMVGIIGKNGAGKSTLLKVIARVLRPTTGRVRIAGTVAPLLEFGAGFHPELTGRENVFMNGTLLGFTRAEMLAKFDRIVDFAELWDFIDAPLRTYSSGMVARLGFAIATDIEPEILILDEVLSVGDAAFQKKSFERIQSFRAAGATILFVSHNHDAVRAMCDRAVWLDHGCVVADGVADVVVDQYLGREPVLAEASLAVSPPMPRQRIDITRVRLLDVNGQEQTVFAIGDPLVLEIGYCANMPTPDAAFGMAIYREDGVHITGPNTALANFALPTLNGRGAVTFSIPHLPLLEGLYHIVVSAHRREREEIYAHHRRRYSFRVADEKGIRERHGLITVRGEWAHRVEEMGND
ncbi:Teichoic acids export ATP-binding protein TagH [Anaerolineae bacterium]|nr:Teichoic acids export ATP-binding protein TagH [Anaerolineae bacterium]